MKKNFSGNKGEWSEPYVVLRLLADGKLFQADEDLNPSTEDFAHILEIVRGDLTATVQDDTSILFNYTNILGEQYNTVVDQPKLLNQAQRLLKSICAIKKKKGAFEIPSEVLDLKSLGFRRLTNPVSKKQKATKRDLGLKLDSPRTGIAHLGFSVKSELGAPPSLLNASEHTNIIYRVKGLSKEQAKIINNLNGSCKIIKRCLMIKQFASSIEYESYNSSVFSENIDVVDSALPQMIADLVKVHYFEQILLPRKREKSVFRNADKLCSAVELLSNKEPYINKNRKDFCEIKIKRFLRACALGLMPSTVWNGKDDASGGYIIVRPDGRLVALYVYNNNLFEKYLYESTIFERASTTKHNFMKLYPDVNTEDYFIKLNLQIRFNK